MSEELIHFPVQPSAAELPKRLTSPFDHRGPHPLARRAAEVLQDQLRSGHIGAAIDLGELDQPGRGKMFGVLVVAAPDGRIGWLRGFSGMLGGRWLVPGFVPPVFDLAAREAFWPAGEAELDAFQERHRALTDGPDATALRARLAELEQRQQTLLAELRARHAANRAERHRERERIAAELLSEETRRARLHALAQASRADTVERRRLEAAFRQEREPVLAQLRALEVERVELERARTIRSNELLEKLWDGYQIPNALGERRSLRALFAPEAPPGGAGDCAAPKLLARAYQLGLKPLALAEFWWGAPPLTGGRHQGVFYPACRRKCGGVLPYMLQGLEVEEAPLLGAGEIDPAEPRTVFEDEWLVVVNKPHGLLSVPGRHDLLRDSVLVRLRARCPDAPQLLVVHRLDLDTSGLLVAAKDAETHAALQKQFARREVEKRYVAWLEGSVERDGGEIILPLRVDLDDRPRQIVDPVHGKPAHTEWRVIERSHGRTRVLLFPRTGRTHQLRVHASHPQGIGVPIVGDRLYGREDVRLMLHAEALAFVHPRTGRKLELVQPAPF